MNDKDRELKIKEIIKHLEDTAKSMHPYEARHIDLAVLELEYYLDR